MDINEFEDIVSGIYEQVDKKKYLVVYEDIHGKMIAKEIEATSIETLYIEIYKDLANPQAYTIKYIFTEGEMKKAQNRLEKYQEKVIKKVAKNINLITELFS